MMAMTNIEKHSVIKKELLSNEFYFQSLLQEAHNQALLSDLELESIQLQCLKLLADNIERYNRGESSSIRVEAAQTIMASNLYTIGIYLKSLPDTSSALDNARSETISELYQQGRGIINTKLNVARHLYRLVCQTKIQSPNHAYNATIGEGIKSFFKQYNPDYEAHETPASIDYQLLSPVIDLTGVEYMIQYLQNLYLENLFCLRFDSNIIHEIMYGYDKAYKDLLVSIFGQVLQNALGCTVLSKDIFSLNLVVPDIEELKSAFNLETQKSIYCFLQRITNTLNRTLSITSEPLKTYINAGLPELASRIHFAINNDTLQTLFVPRHSSAEYQIIKYSTGREMDGETYRNIVKKVLGCRLSHDKIRIIKEHVKSLTDMEDMIIDAELTETEALTALSMLDDVEIAVLIKRHSYCQEIYATNLPEREIRLHRYLEKHLQGIPKGKIKHLPRILSTIEDIEQ